MKKTFSVAGILGGILSIIFSFHILNYEANFITSHRTYGGDAYTGIQNAAADTANNILVLTDAIKYASFAVLFVLGILAICYFGIQLLAESNNQEVQFKNAPNTTKQVNQFNSPANELNKQEISSNKQGNDLPNP